MQYNVSCKGWTGCSGRYVKKHTVLSCLTESLPRLAQESGWADVSLWSPGLVLFHPHTLLQLRDVGLGDVGFPPQGPHETEDTCCTLHFPQPSLRTGFDFCNTSQWGKYFHQSPLLDMGAKTQIGLGICQRSFLLLAQCCSETLLRS